MSEIPGVFAAFAAGLLSFASPCVLPLIPSYLTVLTGGVLSELRDSHADAEFRNRVFFRSLAFVSGFSVVFIALGFLLSSSAAMLGGASRKWGTAAGIVVIVLGLNIVFDFLKFLNFEKRSHAIKRPAGFFGAFAFGSAFAAGWSPCIGPILASILLLAGRGTSARAVLLLSAYSFGLALPFLLAGVFFGRLEGLLKAMTNRMRLIKLVSGTFLSLIGASMILGNFQGFNSVLTRAGYALAEAAAANGGSVRAMTAVIYAAAAFLPVLYRLMKKDPLHDALNRPSVFVPLIIFSGLCVSEASGILKSAALISAWLLYQGI